MTMTIVNHDPAVTLHTDVREEVEELRRMVAVRDEEITRLELCRSAAETRIEEINDAAIEWADQNNLCGEFERFCDEYGLRGRLTDVTATVRVTLTVPVSGLTVRRGCDRHDVEAEISNSTIVDALREEFDVEIAEWTVSDWDTED